MHYCWSLQDGQEQNWFGAPTCRTGPQHSPRALQASSYSPLCMPVCCIKGMSVFKTSQVFSQYLPCWILLRRKGLIVSINQGVSGYFNWRQTFLNSIIPFWLLFQNSQHKHWQQEEVYFFVNTKLRDKFDSVHLWLLLMNSFIALSPDFRPTWHSSRWH